VELQRSLADYAANDIALFAISFDSVEVLAAFGEKHGIGYPLLSDEGSHAIRALGLLNDRLEELHAFYGVATRDDMHGVAHAGTFALDEQGIVTDKRFESSYRVRETGVALLERSFGLRSSVRGPEARAEGPGVAVRAYLDEDVYRFFQRLWLTVDLDIAPDLHVYGQPIPAGYVPFSIDVAPVEGMVVGAMQGPSPHPFRVAGLDEEFLVYSGDPSFSLPLTFTEKVGDLAVRATIRYQACSATDCLLPVTLELALPLAECNNVDSDR
jgi:peroxiredoxin